MYIRVCFFFVNSCSSQFCLIVYSASLCVYMCFRFVFFLSLYLALLSYELPMYLSNYSTLETITQFIYGYYLYVHAFFISF